MNQNIFPFRTCHVEGYKTKFIHTRIVCHINGTGARETAPAYLHPYRLFAYITGFSNTCSDLCFYIENEWKTNVADLRWQGIIDLKTWAYSANAVISQVAQNNCFGVLPSDLKLICLFDEEN